MSKIIGNDLGTTNSAVASSEGTEKQKSPIQAGNRTTRLLCSSKWWKWSLVMRRKRQAVTNPDTIMSIKSKMGTSEKVSANGKESHAARNFSHDLQYLKKFPYVKTIWVPKAQPSGSCYHRSSLLNDARNASSNQGCW